MVDDEFLTVNEVAATLKINPQTVRNWIDAGSMPALRVGRRVRIKRSDFEAILEQSYNGPREPEPAVDSRAAEDFWNGDLVVAPDLGDSGRRRPGGEDGGGDANEDEDAGDR